MEDYKKKYKKALERARVWKEKSGMPIDRQGILDDIFPELKESEDEKIIKSIKDAVEYYWSDDTQAKNDIIVWLEKQGEKINAIENFDTEFEKQVSHLITSAINKEHKYNEGFVKWAANSLLNYAKRELEKQGEQKSQGKSVLEVWKDMRFEVYQQATGNRHKPNCSDDSTKMFSLTNIDEIFEKVAEKQDKQKSTDKVKPKFKVGDYIINGHGFIMQIDGIDNNMYIYHVLDNTDEKLTYDIIKTDKSCHLWTLQDAKNGDIIVSSKITILFKKFQEESDCNYIIAYAGIDISGKLQITDGHWLISNDAKPASKEQRDLLFQKIKEAGYEWDAEKKELSKIEQISNWSEEDELFLKLSLENLIDIEKIYGSEYGKIGGCIDWLNSLKERIKGK